jgi:hypothetical protein
LSRLCAGRLFPILSRKLSPLGCNVPKCAFVDTPTGWYPPPATIVLTTTNYDRPTCLGHSSSTCHLELPKVSKRSQGALSRPIEGINMIEPMIAGQLHPRCRMRLWDPLSCRLSWPYGLVESRCAVSLEVAKSRYVLSVSNFYLKLTTRSIREVRL